ncbi:hypothetical protein CHELA17_60465 [Chelatococcus asaccharovorans]|nr:hypothetical protein CHELA17_60465 [Chelatococcus asaccharovorans]
MRHIQRAGRGRLITCIAAEMLRGIGRFGFAPAGPFQAVVTKAPTFSSEQGEDPTVSMGRRCTWNRRGRLQCSPDERGRGCRRRRPGVLKPHANIA